MDEDRPVIFWMYLKYKYSSSVKIFRPLLNESEISQWEIVDYVIIGGGSYWMFYNSGAKH